MSILARRAFLYPQWCLQLEQVEISVAEPAVSTFLAVGAICRCLCSGRGQL